MLSCSYGLLSRGQAHIAWNKLAGVGNTKLETAHEEKLEEEVEKMQGLINGLKRKF